MTELDDMALFIGRCIGSTATQAEEIRDALMSAIRPLSIESFFPLDVKGPSIRQFVEQCADLLMAFSRYTMTGFGGIATQIGNERCISILEHENKVMKEMYFFHEAIHLLASLGYLPIAGQDEIIAQAIGAAYAKSRMADAEFAAHFSEDAVKGIRIGYSLAEEGRIVLDTAE
jgi:hypothetical protein